jgi:hypothetical protein
MDEDPPSHLENPAEFAYAALAVCVVISGLGCFMVLRYAPLQLMEKEMPTERKIEAQFISLFNRKTNGANTIYWWSGHHSIMDFKRSEPGSCLACNFTVRNSDPDSSPRDLVITTVLGSLTSIVPFVRTLRTTGSRATLVVLTDQVISAEANPSLSSFLDACGCSLLPVPKKDNIIHRASISEIYMARIQMCYDFLKERYWLFDRVLLADIFDTVFQGDPFYKGLGRDFVALSEESFSCSGNHRSAVKLLMDPVPVDDRWWSVKCKNTGLMIGGARPLLMYLSVLLEYAAKIPLSILERIPMTDQVFTNTLLSLGVLEARGVPFRFWKEGEPYIAMWNIWERHNVTYRLGDFRLFENGMYPLGLHMFDRHKGFTFSVLGACPESFKTGSPYVRIRHFWY